MRARLQESILGMGRQPSDAVVDTTDWRQPGSAEMTDLLFGFTGRVNRAKFWLVALGIFVVEAVVFSAMGGAALMSADPQTAMESVGAGSGIVMALVILVAAWISIAVAVKRYHDRNKSGWWVLIIFVPVIGGLWYFIECGFLPGTRGPNTYGPDPIAAG